VDGEFSDVTARKKDRAHHVGIGAESDALAADRENCSIVQGLEQFVPELREHHFLHELMAQLSTAAMSKNDLVVICDWDRTDRAKETGVGCFRASGRVR
jgi:hypothetical protein